MNRLNSLIATLLLMSCQKETELFDDVKYIADFKMDFDVTLIQTGEESGSFEPIMEYSIYKIDSSAFVNLTNLVETSERFKEGLYYLNIEINDYLLKNKLEILNLAKCSIIENKYDKIYRFYLLSDGKTIVVIKINS